MKSNNLYILLFHGRNQPSDELNDWGFDGPLIGPVGVSWTYNAVKLHDPSWNDHECIPVYLDLVKYQGKYYGDFEILTEDDPLFARAKGSGEPHSYEEFVKNIKAK